MNKIPNYITEELFDNIETSIREYHKGIFDAISIKSEYWETILDYALHKQGHKTIYERGSHKVGADIEIKNISNGRISCKAGSLVKKSTRPAIKISSYRSTQYKTLDEKLIHFDNDHEDIIMSLAYIKPLRKDSFKHKYIMSVFNPLKFMNMEWEERIAKDNVVNWLTVNNIIDADIYPQHSGQLWYRVPLDTIDHKREIIIDE